MSLKRGIICIALVGLGLVALLEVGQIRGEQTKFTSFFAGLVFQHNLHEVTPAKFYRSAQMTPGEIGAVVDKLGIKTVIDLRLGKEDGEIEEQEERNIVLAKGAQYVHLPLRGSRVPRPEKIEQILQTLDQAELPVLVHCSSGTHRSGLVSAIWLLTHGEGSSVDLVQQAESQLSMKYGFFRFEREIKSLFQGHPTIDYLLWMYTQRNKVDPIPFRDWVEEYKREA